MTLSTCKKALSTKETLIFQLPDGSFVPSHFHITEVGLLTREFIDCGGKIRNEKKVNFQLWYSNDIEHRLTPKKLLGIIEKSEKLLSFSDDLAVEVEYQGETIGKYSLDIKDDLFILRSTETACLAEDACGIPSQKEVKALKDLSVQPLGNSCTPGGSCC